MSVASTRRYLLSRAIERGDPRLGLIVGFLLSLLCALASSGGLVEPLELRALDFAFRHRAPIRESDKIAIVDIDDLTLREFRFPIRRDYLGHAIWALDHLGARQIVLDVQTKMIMPRSQEFDEQTGEQRLEPEDKVFRAAILRSAKVLLPYAMDTEGRLLKDFADPEGQAFFDKVRAELERRPGATYSELRQAMLPNFDPRQHQWELRALQYAYWSSRGRHAIDAKSPDLHLEGGSLRAPTPYGILMPEFAFLEPARSVGSVNADPDADGVMRRPWAFLRLKDRAYPYLGLVMALQELEGPDERVEIIQRPGAIELRNVARGDGALRKSVSLPLDGEGRLLVNWAGNGRRRRGAGEVYFSHIPFRRVVEFYEKRYRLLDENVRSTIAQLRDEERQAIEAEKYEKLSGRFRQVLDGTLELPPAEARALEDRVEKLRENMVREFNAYISASEKSLTVITAPRAKEKAIQTLAKWREQVTAITAPDDFERELRSYVAGKICLIGSASTASGDLHATPLGAATPGMDVLANVANMALTGQVIRRAPTWVNFVYLFALGFLVSFYVTHWGTAASTVATLATAAGSALAFWLLFTGPVLLIAGAGPIATALLTFAGVTAYKELVTQRSKRKLQRELEKNTSPALVKILLEHPEFLSRPRKMIGTFFFSDVKSFTSITEKMDAEVLFPFINRYLDRVTQALIGHEAFVDKYIGDGIMALFGIPVPNPNHAANACKAALDCQLVLKGLNAEFAVEGLPEVKMRIGIHSGEVRAGNVGSLYRSNYTVLGDNVNLSARLESANKEYDTSIMISESTWDMVSGRFVARELDRIRVVGKRRPVRIFELLGVAGSPLPMPPAFLEAYAAALQKFKDREWAEAMAAFQKALELKPGDRPSQTYIERAKVFQLMPPPPDWEGVFELTSK